MNPNDWLAKLPSPLASATPGEPRQWYRIQALAQADGDGKAADEVDVYLYGVIGGWWSGVNAAQFVRELRDIDAKQINVHINSVGGSVYDGNAIFQALRNHKARIVTYVDALAASAASIVAMAGDRRVVAPYAELMVHKAWGLCIGNDEDMEKARDDLARISRTLAKVYTNRSTSDATVDDWLGVMSAETWYDADEAVEAGLMHEVQEDAEKTIPDDGDDEASAMNRYALEFFGVADRAARSAMARAKPVAEPVPVETDPNPTDTAAMVDTNEQKRPAASAPADPDTNANPTLEAPEPSTSDALIQALRDDVRAHYAPPAVAEADPELPAAEPETTETEPKEDPVSDLSDIRSRLGLADDADSDAIAAAVDALKAKADAPAPAPEPDPQQVAAVAEQAQKFNALENKVALLTEQLTAAAQELADTRAQKAADEKNRVLGAARRDGKFKPADYDKWAERYDKDPETVTDVLASIPAGTAVPVNPQGYTDSGESTGDGDDEFDRMFSTPAPKGA